MYSGTKAAESGRDLGAGWETRDKRIWGAGKARRLHATGDRPVRRVLHPGDHDVLRLDLRHADDRDPRAVTVLAQLSGSAVGVATGEESEWWPAETSVVCRRPDARPGAADPGRTHRRCRSIT
uniref:(northern house mosquito) hypothetical protein n=1 Tax=Culex pipiens TaxID=7175 RepID=A0A8D8E1P8_CULPI